MSAASQASPPRVALLTGATGFLGAHLLSVLLDRTSLQLRCLVRASGEPDARAALARVQALYGLPSAADDDRLQMVTGDLAEPRLGLRDAAFDALADEVEVIYHCGAQISSFAPYRVLAPANVGGTREILRLAARGTATRLHHISSLAIGGAATDDEGPPLPEARRVAAASDLGGYARSKLDAEQLVNDEADRGLPVTIYRPGRITSHSDTGACAPRDALTLLLAASLRLGVAPAFEAMIHLTPVDTVSQLILRISQTPEASGRAMHLLSPLALSWQAIAEILLQRLGAVSDIVPYDDWRARVRAPERDHDPLLSLVRVLADRPALPFSRARRIVATEQTMSIADGIAYPTEATVLIERCVAFLQRYRY